MTKYADKKFALVGAGLIGAQWAVHFLRNGIKDITLYDAFPASLERAKERIDEALTWFAENGVITEEEKKELVKLPRFTTDMKEAVGDADFILEQVFENLELKQKTLAEIEAACRDDAIITSSTSGIMIRFIAEHAKHPERVIGAHPYLPVYLLPLVEIVIDEKVKKENLDTVVDMFRSIKKKPVVLKKDCPAYLGTRLMITLFREAASVVSQGICTIQDIDDAFTFGPGLRYALVGINMTYQLTGGDGGFQGFIDGPMATNFKNNPALLASFTQYPDNIMDYLKHEESKDLQKILDEKGWDNNDLVAFRDKGLLELLKVHDLL